MVEIGDGIERREEKDMAVDAEGSKRRDRESATILSEPLMAEWKTGRN